MKKKIFVYISFFCLLFIFTTPLAGATSFEGGRVVYLTMDGQSLPHFDVPSIIVQNRTFVPLRHVFEFLGAVVDFHPVEQRILIAYNQHLIIMHIGAYEFFFNGEMLLVDVAPQIIEDRTMVPLSAITTALGFGVDWDNDTSTVHLTTGNSDLPPASPPTTTPPTTPAPTTPPTMLPQTPPTHDPTSIAALSTDNSEVILPESNLLTTVDNITWNSERTQFTISAAARITAVEWQMLEDGRLMIDIVNAQANFTPSSHIINNGFLRNVRTGQNYVNGNSVARVVFDLVSPVTYRVTLSYDRRHIVVTFEPNQITSIHFTSNVDLNNTESISIYGITSPIIDTFFLSNPERLVIDLPNARMLDSGAISSNGHFAQSVRFDQFDANTARVVVDLAASVSFTITHDHATASVTIRLSEPTYRNIYYNEDTGILSIRRPWNLDSNQLLRFDDYTNLRYNFTLPSDFSEFFGYGSFWVQDGDIDFIEIVTYGGLTTFIINAIHIRSYIVTQDASFIHIQPVNPRMLYPFIVYLDPGHGGLDPGAVHNGMRESDLVLEISLIAYEILRRDGLVQVYMSRNADVAVSNAQRAAQANDIADIFVSVHINAANGVATGIETLYAIHSAESAHFNSRDMAQIFQDNLYAALETINRRLWHRPGILVLNSTRIPAVLLEIEFMDAQAGAERLRDPLFLLAAAQAIVDSIYEVKGIYTPAR